MHKIIALALACMLVMGLMAGCRSRNDEPAATTTRPTTMAPLPIPGPEDTVDPSSGANRPTPSTAPGSTAPSGTTLPSGTAESTLPGTGSSAPEGRYRDRRLPG